MSMSSYLPMYAEDTSREATRQGCVHALRCDHNIARSPPEDYKFFENKKGKKREPAGSLFSFYIKLDIQISMTIMVATYL